MSFIDTVKTKLDEKKYFNYETTEVNYIRLLDTPHIFGLPFNEQIMDRATTSQKEFERAIEEIIQKTIYRCDISSLHSPDPEWGKVILRSIDVCLSQKLGRTKPVQFRFLFGQTPYNILYPPYDLNDFRPALARLVQERGTDWEVMPEIYIGVFSRVYEGIISGLESILFSPEILDSEDEKMTWNHNKIIAVDGAESLVGGHNLNMDLFINYPPVHDVSVVIHGQGSLGSQQYLNQLWACDSDLLNIQKLDITNTKWVNIKNNKIDDPIAPGTPGFDAMKSLWKKLIDLHKGVSYATTSYEKGEEKTTTEDFKENLIPLPKPYTTYDKLDEYKAADRILCLGKYWIGSNLDTDFKIGSELMKETLIKGAKKIIRMSQQDIISAWKNKWRDHSVAIWLIEALLTNPELEVQIVVSPLDASAGSEGDQYSFGSGAQRTMDLIRYYMTHDIDTDKLLDDSDGKRADAIKRITIAPFFYTDKVDDAHLIEGETYKWPNVDKSSYTNTLKMPPLSEHPPEKGIIGSAAYALIMASGISSPVAPAPGNHAKITIIDDELYIVGSDNMYPGYLSEVDFLVEGKDAVTEILESYWNPLWKYSSMQAAK